MAAEGRDGVDMVKGLTAMARTKGEWGLREQLREVRQEPAEVLLCAAR
jgi:hypothetical protein